MSCAIHWRRFGLRHSLLRRDTKEFGVSQLDMIERQIQGWCGSWTTCSTSRASSGTMSNSEWNRSIWLTWSTTRWKPLGIISTIGVIISRYRFLRTDSPMGDPIRLEQVISNLLSNAAKYTDAGGEVASSSR